METGSVIVCIVSAVIGAGFASGREILHFFSRYGPLSWGLIILCVAVMGWMMERVMGLGAPVISSESPLFRGWKGFFALVLLLASGVMTSAAGELAALTWPILHARSLGMILTLMAGMGLSRVSLKALSLIGRLLIPMIAMIWGLCLGRPGESALPAWTPERLPGGVLGVLSYAGLNVMLSNGVLCAAGANCSTRTRRRAAYGSAVAVGLLLCVENGALLKHGNAVSGQALPLVVLLRSDGKAGFYLAAGALYLAVLTTLIAVLSGVYAAIEKTPCFLLDCLVGLSAMAVALCGFEELIAVAYPMAGLLCAGVLIAASRKRSTKSPKEKSAR